METVDLARLRVELDGEPHAVAGRDVADLLDAARGGLDVPRAHVDGTHHRGAAQTGRPFALLGEDAEQAAPHVAIRPHPSCSTPTHATGRPLFFTTSMTASASMPCSAARTKS